MTTGKIIATIAGALLALVSLGVLAAGGGLLWAYTAQQDADGFISAPASRFTTDGHAVVVTDVDLHVDPAEGVFVPDVGDVTVRIEATPAGDSGDLFVGIAPAMDVEAYLSEVSHTVVEDLDPGGQAETRAVIGTESPAPPTEEHIWAAQSTGQGEQTLTWDLQSGSWAAVLMNADGSAGVEAVAAGGVAVSFLLPLAIGLLLGGLVLLAVAAVIIVLATRSVTGVAVGRAPTPATAATTAYPVTLEARLDPDLSRWQWLVKWFLAIPHFVVLAFLWAAFAVLTVVAGFSILFTRRYPRSIFDFNVGVLRWTWRVSYYATSALGTDRYPPFTLAPVDYPATFDVEYPEELSRGLVLVKWWLLAIPHYVIVGLFAGNLLSWTFVDSPASEGGLEVAFGGGLIGLLALIAVLALTFTGRYPRGLYDLIVGLNRWVYRVIAYVALMRDEYPPFRLDMGGSEPPASPPPPPAPADDDGAQRTLTPA